MSPVLQQAPGTTLADDGSPHATLRFGSFCGRLRAERAEYTEAVRLVFGAEIRPAGSEPMASSGQFDLRIAGPESPTSADSRPEPPTHGMLIGGTSQQPTITTEALYAELRTDTAPIQIRIWVRKPEFPYLELCFHFSVVLNKLLFLMDRVIVHGAAVQWHDSVNLFVGEKGAGKSTICLALARAGATVLGEDRLILRRVENGFLISGGDERSRLTERTERHFFAEPLNVAAQDFAGTMKKEIRMGDYFRSRPYRDFPPHRLIFPQVTGRFELQRMSGQAALLRLLRHTAHFHRFAGIEDQKGLIDLLAAFTASIPVFHMELSLDLADLDRLAERIRVA